MIFTSQDKAQLKALMDESPEKQALIQKLLDYHQYSISQISHEIRNPLALVYSTLQLIETKHPEVTKIKHWHYMRDDIEYMKTLLEELSRLNNSERLNLNMVDLNSLLEHMMISFAASLVDENIEFTSRLDPALPTITGDKIKLQELFLNLLQNAREAVNNQGSITFNAVHNEKNIIVKISDTGCGIAKKDLSDIFTPFVTHKQGGTGLGLAIAEKTIQAHCGTIEVDSIPGKGTTFTVTIPIK